MKRFDVVVRGAGAVGSCLALALSRQGLAVALQDAAARAGAPPREDVRAYALNAGSVQLLRELKVWDALPSDARCAVYDMHVQGDADGSALDFSAWSQGVEALAWIVDAAELDRVLAAAVSFAPHVQCLSEGQAQAPLLALCEGKASRTREQLGVAMPVHRYGHSAVAARLCSDLAHAGLARQWFRSPDVLALLPFDRPEPDKSYALVWSVPQARADELLALAEATGAAAGRLRLGSARAVWPLSLARAERVCGAGWVLLGDAAHVVHPLAGQGLNLGLADVRALAQVIAQRESWRGLGDERLLQRYARQRALPTRAMGQLTDGLLQLFASEAPALRELRNRGLSLVNGLPPLKRLLTTLALDA